MRCLRALPDRRASQRLALHEPRQPLVQASRRRSREERLGRRHDRRPRKRLGADDPSRPRLNERLIEDLDLLLSDDALQHDVLDGSGGRRCCPIGRPPPPLEYRFQPLHADPINVRFHAQEPRDPVATRNGTVTRPASSLCSLRVGRPGAASERGRAQETRQPRARGFARPRHRASVVRTEVASAARRFFASATNLLRPRKRRRSLPWVAMVSCCTLHAMLDGGRSVPVFGMNRGTVGFLMNDWRIDCLPERLAGAKAIRVAPLEMRATTVAGDTRPRGDQRGLPAARNPADGQDRGFGQWSRRPAGARM